MTSRSDSGTSLHRVCTWKSQSRNGSYPGTLGPHVEMVPIGRPVPEDFRPEVPDVQIEHRSLAHRPVAPRRGPHPAARIQIHEADGRQPSAKIRVLPMEFDAAVETSNAPQPLSSPGEVPALQNRPQSARRMHQRTCPPPDEGI